MLVRLMYASRAADSVTADTLHALLKQCNADNPAKGITGVLCLCTDQRLFMQLIEGGRSAVNQLYNNIIRDPRHTDVVLLGYEEITERRFAGWAMGQVNISRLNRALLLKYSEGPRLDPYSVSGAASLKLFEELAATAAVMGERG